jgi:hypothetical protein
MKQLVRITKISTLENPRSDLGLCDGYCVEGYLLEPIQKGQSVKLERTKRNDKKIYGYFQTSTVQSVEDETFKTLNSCYKIDYIM